MEFEYVYTSDALKLQGVHYPSPKRGMLILFTHGMSGNIIEDPFAHALGETLAAAGFGFLFAHNRGYNHINDIIRGENPLGDSGGMRQTVRCGTMYELFPDCLLDIDAWLQKGRDLGYRQIVIMGHSLGCTKIIYHFSQRLPRDVIGMILASPPDMVGLMTIPAYQPNSAALYEEAHRNIAAGQPRKLLSEMIWEWFPLSSQTFLSLFSEGSPADNLPLLRNPEHFPQLAAINIPILAFMGEYDDIVIRSIPEDLELISSKARTCPTFRKEVIPNSGHSYDRQKTVVTKLIHDWLTSL